jgi:ankyrin repeat protein
MSMAGDRCCGRLERGHEAVVRLLVERDDVAVDSKDKSGRRPLSLATERGHDAVVQLLVERDDVTAELEGESSRVSHCGGRSRRAESIDRTKISI